MKMTALTFHIIYASASGNVEIVSEYISQLLEKEGIKTKLYRAEMTDAKIIEDNTHFIFSTSTWNAGLMNPYFDGLYKGMDELDLKGKQAGFVGLGDVRYEKAYFCEGIETLKERFIDKGGKEIHKTVKLNGEPQKLLDTVVFQWMEHFLEAINNGK